MSFVDLEALKVQALSLGLSGDDDGKFVLQQQAIEREERAAEHEEFTAECAREESYNLLIGR